MPAIVRVVTLVGLLALAVAVWPAADRASAQRQPSLRDVLARAGDYVVASGEQLATVVGTEEYEQALVADDGLVMARRELQAELAFVPLAGGRDWQAFRNVLRVDGEAVAGADRRFEQLMREAPASLVGQARRIAAESARYNLGPLLRTFNAPTMPLQFLHPAHQDRFRFDRQGEETIAGERVWVVRLRDRGGASLIRSTTGRAVPVDGRAWIVPDEGRIVRASFEASGFLPDERGRPASHATLEVWWRHDERLGLWVPDEMRERYTGPWDEGGQSYAITGHARYTGYQRFEVDVRMLGITR
jgi:hypothetical protein